MTIRVSPGQPDDAANISQILSNWIDETDWMPRIHTRQEDLGFGSFLLEKTQVMVAKDGQSLVGFIARRGSEIEALYIAQDARRRGIGRTLIENAKAATDDLALWTFQANLAAQAFYQKLGFTEVKRTDGQGNDEKLPDIRLIWSAKGHP